jgi:hypothetical protein
LLSVDNEAARERKFEYGTRIIPQVTWFYTHNSLSCPQKSFENIMLYYGQCPVTEVTEQLIEDYSSNHDCKNASNLWLSKFYSMINLDGAASRLISSYYMQLYLYESSMSGGRVSSTTLLNLADVKSERYHQHQRFSHEELTRAAKRDNSEENIQTRTTYGSKANAKVGKPFIPHFKLIKTSQNSTDDCPTVTAAEEMDSPFSLYVVGEQNLNLDSVLYDKENLLKYNTDGAYYQDLNHINDS